LRTSEHSENVGTLQVAEKKVGYHVGNSIGGGFGKGRESGDLELLVITPTPACSNEIYWKLQQWQKIARTHNMGLTKPPPPKITLTTTETRPPTINTPPGPPLYRRCGSYDPQLLHYPEAETFTPYNDLKTQTYHPAKDKKMQRNNDTVQAMLLTLPSPD
jgi:hypothetical protein